ncbi:hypothetical protein B835_1695 [Enterococcus mundtii 3F]|nr:hypothetical protein [Enterococcus mundtii 3F]
MKRIVQSILLRSLLFLFTKVIFLLVSFYHALITRLTISKTDS